MKNAIILHGGPSKKEYYDLNMPSMSNSHWLPWLQAQLLKKDITTLGICFSDYSLENFKKRK